MRKQAQREVINSRMRAGAGLVFPMIKSRRTLKREYQRCNGNSEQCKKERRCGADDGEDGAQRSWAQMGWGGCQCGHQPLLGEEFRRRAGGARTHQDLVNAPHPLSGPMGIKGAASQSLSAENGSQAGWADLVLSET